MAKRGGPKKNLLRVVIRNIDVEIWEDFESLGRFLCALRALARNSYMIVYLTANSFGVEEDTWRTLETSSDLQIQLKEFDEGEKKTFRHLGSVNGYFYLKSLPTLMSVGTHTPPILDLIFEASSRKGIQIRVMHLPCLMDDPAAAKNPKPAELSCQKIDF
uniref:Elongator complex protein 4 n=1 Tax=Caenorhabditis japonica TaxID=281687 RepID=A0A8R1EG29_CAEJA